MSSSAKGKEEPCRAGIAPVRHGTCVEPDSQSLHQHCRCIRTQACTYHRSSWGPLFGFGKKSFRDINILLLCKGIWGCLQAEMVREKFKLHNMERSLTF